jgi:hypothetical protein
MKYFAVVAALTLTTSLMADDITLSFTTGSASTNDQAGYYGGGNVGLSNIAASLSWTTDPSD